MELDTERADVAGRWLIEQIAVNGFAGVRLALERETEALISRSRELSIKISENTFKLEVLAHIEEMSGHDYVDTTTKSRFRLIKTEEVNHGERR